MGNPMKAAAEWFYNTVFQDEAIRPQSPRHTVQLPAMLRTARSLELGARQVWQSRESIFLKQAKLLALYEDDYDCQSNVQYYYPTYQSLSDGELRGYFAWRTKLRRGDVRKTSLTFAFLYIYELLNQIGAEDPPDGYRKLREFREIYGRQEERILPYLNRWLVDYAVYYGLDPALVSDLPQTALNRSITVLEHVREEEPEAIARAAAQLAPKWLGRSKFYGAHREDMDRVIAGVLRRMSSHFDARCKKTMVEQYFGAFTQQQVHLFNAAVFCDPLKRRSGEYALDEQCIYFCKNGVWTVRRRSAPPRGGAQLEDLMKTIDAVMRQVWSDRYPVKPALETKWILRIIQEEAEALRSEQRAAEEQRAAQEKKLTFDYTQLARIRRDAAVTQEKLIVDEEEPAGEELQLSLLPEEPAPLPEPSIPAGAESESPLSPPEYRLMQCLLYGGDTGWVQAEGHLLSVLVDGINEKLYDAFQDTVLDDTPQVVEDYIDDLKEMVHP